MSRIVCQFSCGAASAIATKLILGEHDPARVVIANAFLLEEHEDNRRFAADCERWFNHPITVLRDEKYGASVHAVWRKERFMKSQYGASCSMRLKRELLDAFVLPGDTLVMGFTAEEEDRAERYIACGVLCPLIDRGLKKADCLAMVRAFFPRTSSRVLPIACGPRLARRSMRQRHDPAFYRILRG